MDLPIEIKFITNDKGEKVEAVIPVDFFFQLIEDYEDVQFSKERLKEDTEG
jgi:hypothetical protein